MYIHIYIYILRICVYRPAEAPAVATAVVARLALRLGDLLGFVGICTGLKFQDLWGFIGTP